MNKLLARQIRRSLGKDFVPTRAVKKLLDTVSQSYDHYERDREILERAMKVSSEELRESYGKLVVQQELENKNSELERFVYMTSHDLKAPLRTIFSFSKLLNRELSKIELTPNAEEYLELISQAAEGMENLILNLLEYSKVSSNPSERMDVDLNKVLMIVKGNLFGLLEENNAKIEFENLPKIQAIPHQMLQLFQNLIGNGIKFKKENVPPVVKVNFKETSDSFIFSVKDNGIGIQESNLKKVFQAFTRLEGAKRFRGTGLGLSICKSIVENMKGKIWVESEYGVGTTFLISIPKETEVEEKESILKNISAKIVM